jgi:hypothetical protein
MGAVLLLLLLLLLLPLAVRRLLGRRPLPGREALIAQVLEAISGPARVGDALWRQGLVERLVGDPRTPRAVLEACQLCRSADRVELLLRRARSSSEALAMAQRISRATREVLDYATAHGLAENLEEGGG